MDVVPGECSRCCSGALAAEYQQTRWSLEDWAEYETCRPELMTCAHPSNRHVDHMLLAEHMSTAIPGYWWHACTCTYLQQNGPASPCNGTVPTEALSCYLKEATVVSTATGASQLTVKRNRITKPPECSALLFCRFLDLNMMCFGGFVMSQWEWFVCGCSIIIKDMLGLQ